jgi:hypothetical protein
VIKNLIVLVRGGHPSDRMCLKMRTRCYNIAPGGRVYQQPLTKKWQLSSGSVMPPSPRPLHPEQSSLFFPVFSSISQPQHRGGRGERGINAFGGYSGMLLVRLYVAREINKNEVGWAVYILTVAAGIAATRDVR